MPIKTITTCDVCDKDISDEDHATIEHRFEIDFNRQPLKNDVRKREFGIYCIYHGNQIWQAVESITNPRCLTRETDQ